MRQKHFTGKREPVSYLTTATAPTSASRPLIDAPARAALLFPEARVEEWKLGKRRCRLWLIPDSEAASVTKRTNMQPEERPLVHRALRWTVSGTSGNNMEAWKRPGTGTNASPCQDPSREPPVDFISTSSAQGWTPSRLSSTPLAPLRASTLHEVDTKKAFKTF
jgi:hypothetical protein